MYILLSFVLLPVFFFKNVTTMKSSVFVLVTLLSTLSMFFSLSDHCLIFTTAWFDLLWRVKGKLVLLLFFIYFHFGFLNDFCIFFNEFRLFDVCFDIERMSK